MASTMAALRSTIARSNEASLLMTFDETTLKGVDCLVRLWGAAGKARGAGARSGRYCDTEEREEGEEGEELHSGLR